MQPGFLFSRSGKRLSTRQGERPGMSEKMVLLLLSRPEFRGQRSKRYKKLRRLTRVRLCGLPPTALEELQHLMFYSVPSISVVGIALYKKDQVTKFVYPLKQRQEKKKKSIAIVQNLHNSKTTIFHSVFIKIFDKIFRNMRTDTQLTKKEKSLLETKKSLQGYGFYSIRGKN